MTTIHASFGGIPAWLLIAYLVELGGVADSESAARGEGWIATLRPSSERIGGLAFTRITVAIEGPAANRIMEALRRKAMRGGG